MQRCRGAEVLEVQRCWRCWRCWRYRRCRRCRRCRIRYRYLQQICRFAVICRCRGAR
jgi:hypothetical protein